MKIIKISQCLIVLLCLAMLSSSCSSNERTDMLDSKDTGAMASMRLEEILEAIKSQDSNAISDMFSDSVQNSATNIETGTEYLFSLFDDEAEISWEKIGGNVSASTKYGKKTAFSKYRFYVQADDKQFLFVIWECLSDADNADNIGLYSIKALDTVNMDIEPEFLDAGIYIDG